MTEQRGLGTYGDLGGLPDLVAEAVRAQRRAGYDRACVPEVGQLLRVLVGSRGAIRIGETGTGCGVGAAWIASAMDVRSTLTTVELDPARAAAARILFARRPNVAVLEGDWSLIERHAPFDLLFADGGVAKTDCRAILRLVAPRGLVVLDDLTPMTMWTEEQREAYREGDPVRTAWRARTDCVTSEVSVSARMAVLLVRRAASSPRDAPPARSGERYPSALR